MVATYHSHVSSYYEHNNNSVIVLLLVYGEQVSRPPATSLLVLFSTCLQVSASLVRQGKPPSPICLSLPSCMMLDIL